MVSRYYYHHHSHHPISPPRLPLNTGAFMPYVNLNLGGTSTNGDHYSNYSEFLCVGGSGLDTALAYSDAINQQIAHAIQQSNTTQQTFPWTFLDKNSSSRQKYRAVFQTFQPLLHTI